jgi:hypothetical protein
LRVTIPLNAFLTLKLNIWKIILLLKLNRLFMLFKYQESKLLFKITTYIYKWVFINIIIFFMGFKNILLPEQIFLVFFNNFKILI